MRKKQTEESRGSEKLTKGPPDLKKRKTEKQIAMCVRPGYYMYGDVYRNNNDQMDHNPFEILIVAGTSLSPVVKDAREIFKQIANPKHRQTKQKIIHVGLEQPPNDLAQYFTHILIMDCQVFATIVLRHLSENTLGLVPTKEYRNSLKSLLQFLK